MLQGFTKSLLMQEFQELNEMVRQLAIENFPGNYSQYPALDQFLSEFGFILVASTILGTIGIMVFFLIIFKKKPYERKEPEKVQLMSEVSESEEERVSELVKKMYEKGMNTEQIVKKLLELRYGPDIINTVIKKAKSSESD